MPYTISEKIYVKKLISRISLVCETCEYISVKSISKKVCYLKIYVVYRLWQKEELFLTNEEQALYTTYVQRSTKYSCEEGLEW